MLNQCVAGGNVSPLFRFAGNRSPSGLGAVGARNFAAATPCDFLRGGHFKALPVRDRRRLNAVGVSSYTPPIVG